MSFYTALPHDTVLHNPSHGSIMLPSTNWTSSQQGQYRNPDANSSSFPLYTAPTPSLDSLSFGLFSPASTDLLEGMWSNPFTNDLCPRQNTQESSEVLTGVHPDLRTAFSHDEGQTESSKRKKVNSSQPVARGRDSKRDPNARAGFCPLCLGEKRFFSHLADHLKVKHHNVTLTPAQVASISPKFRQCKCGHLLRVNNGLGSRHLCQNSATSSQGHD
jgi:hypothetical protein